MQVNDLAGSDTPAPKKMGRLMDAPEELRERPSQHLAAFFLVRQPWLVRAVLRMGGKDRIERPFPDDVHRSAPLRPAPAEGGNGAAGAGLGIAVLKGLVRHRIPLWGEQRGHAIEQS